MINCKSYYPVIRSCILPKYALNGLGLTIDSGKMCTPSAGTSGAPEKCIFWNFIFSEILVTILFYCIGHVLPEKKEMILYLSH